MKLFSFSIFLFLLQFSYGQVTLDADGPGNTYELITSVLAPGSNPIEVPDCSHNAFGEHIDEIFDSELNTNVFRFFIHTTPDDDRCINFDRQRNEIKSYDKSPDNLLGIEGEKVVYRWKFKLESGFQSSQNFTHIHQLKSVGGLLASMPMYTLTTRKGSSDQLELRYAETDAQVTLKKTDLAPFIGTWVEVTETIEYGVSGTYEIEIKQVSDDQVLFSYSNNSIVNWRSGADFVRPKWGIYRSLINAQDLRDEVVSFANFSIEELVSSEILSTETEKHFILSNPASGTIQVTEIIPEIESIQLLTLDGRKLLDVKIDSNSVQLDVSSIPNGTYVLKTRTAYSYHSELVIICH